MEWRQPTLYCLLIKILVSQVSKLNISLIECSVLQANSFRGITSGFILCDFCCFWGRVLVRRPHTGAPPLSTFQVLDLHACVVTCRAGLQSSDLYLSLWTMSVTEDSVSCSAEHIHLRASQLRCICTQGAGHSSVTLVLPFVGCLDIKPLYSSNSGKWTSFSTLQLTGK